MKSTLGEMATHAYYSKCELAPHSSSLSRTVNLKCNPSFSSSPLHSLGSNTVLGVKLAQPAQIVKDNNDLMDGCVLLCARDAAHLVSSHHAMIPPQRANRPSPVPVFFSEEGDERHESLRTSTCALIISS